MQDNPTDATGIVETDFARMMRVKVIIPREPESAIEMFITESRFAIDPAEYRTVYRIRAGRALNTRADFPLICRMTQYNMLSGGKHAQDMSIA